MTTQASPSRFPWVATIIAVVLALAGVALLTFALVSVRSENTTAPKPTTPATAVAVKPNATAIVIPTITAPAGQAAATQAPATGAPETPVPATAAPAQETAAPAAAATATPAPAGLTIIQPANVRTGPGTVYPVIGGIEAGKTTPVLGRDAGGTWFVVQYGAGQGWVSGIVAQYSGDVNSLPVIAAPPPPKPTATPIPTATPVPTVVIPTNPPPPSNSSHGISGDSFSISNVTAGVNAQVVFDFQVTNNTDSDISYGALSAHTDVGATGKSWTNSVLKAHQVLKWHDHMQFGSTGTYQVYLGICFDDGNTCYSGSRSWDRLSNNITVTIQ